MMKHRLWAVTSFVAVSLTAYACTSQVTKPDADISQSTWVKYAPRADGYTIDVVSVQPTPGTRLKAGSAVTFRVKAKYSMSIADRGRVTLVFQVGNQPVPGTSPQVSQTVQGASGVVELTQVVLVPPGGGNDLLLFVPLNPEGLVRTGGEAIVFYPINDGSLDR
jgi:hypothetical protein